MSDTQQGPGWWKASDGKWYPPQQPIPQRAPARLASESMVVSAPMSFAGSAKRIWKITQTDNAAMKWLVLVPFALLAVLLAWTAVACWYLLFGILLVPYRLLRRGSRKRNVAATQHREILDEMRRQQGR